MTEIQNKVALVTGGGNGIGKAIVQELSNLACHVAVADIDKEGADKVAQEIEASGSKAIAIKGDVSSTEDVKAMVDNTIDSFGRIDILVNNAGITRDNLLMRMSEEEWDLVIRINLKGAFLCTKQIIRPMMKQRSGKIINIASVVGVMGNAGQANYAASKAGLIGLTKSTAKEVASRNIQVNAIAPGYIETEMTDHLSDEVKEAFLSVIPSKTAGHAEDVAKVVAFLASPASDYMTGQVLHVDGGMVM